ncbi:NADP-binding protein [Dacryopinax primogenitus]|uniref:NADP-binding protein n=1 Tax=Dacryopinax primogenitus (strain DJM 731) TaxID=1858805 RepID=M5GBK2_DACPD|nr:NADP-binding protein [Dacryopinax primogenitus]EJU01383.1 NADP-binding protein [Dacryopinax primogenitus]
MSDKKLVVVLGATGLQGGSVISALLSSPSYAVRGVTRDPSSSAALSLSGKGVHMVAGDLSSPSSLLSAFQGAWAVFGVTLPFTAVPELVQGKNIVDACRAVSVQVLVWSSLSEAKKVSGGKYTKVKHWDEKAEVDEYIKSVQQEAIILQTGGFVENLHNMPLIRSCSQAPGAYIVIWPVVRPATQLPLSYIGPDFGPCVIRALEVWEAGGEGRENLTRAPIPVCSFTMSVEQMIDVLRKVTGTEIRYTRPTQMPTEELQEMMLLVDDGLNFPNVPFPTELFVELGVKFHTFEDYVKDELVPKMENGEL